MLTPLLALLAFAAAVVAARRHHRAERAPGHLAKLDDDTTMGSEGAVRSVQTGELTLPADALEQLWSPLQLERLARTYWRFLSRCTLGLVRVDYASDARTVVFLRRPLRLLRFKAPEYAMDAHRGTVRWRIEDGLLVQRRRHGDGYLQIDVRRLSASGEDPARIRVEVAVANFYPSIAQRLSSPVYRITQSRIHVLVTYGFLRSLARLDLAESRVGRFAAGPTVDDVPDPPLGRAGPESAAPAQP